VTISKQLGACSNEKEAVNTYFQKLRKPAFFCFVLGKFCQASPHHVCGVRTVSHLDTMFVVCVELCPTKLCPTKQQQALAN
tara:strand:+ start:404 stop:646 length:243 start_codon:yes stop_codon:yes gene_type:complete